MQPAGQAFRLRAGHSEQATLYAKEMYFEKTWQKKYLDLIENQSGVYLVSLAAVFVSSRNAPPQKRKSVAWRDKNGSQGD